MRLDRGAAGDERQGSLDEGRRLRAGRRADFVEEALDESLRLLRLEQSRHRAQEDAAAAELLKGEAQPFEIARPFPEQIGLARPQLERLGKEQDMGGEGSRGEVAAELLEQHALVGDVLVDEEDLLVAARDDEGLLKLADDGPEAPRAERSRRLMKERPLVLRRNQSTREVRGVGQYGGHFGAPVLG